MAKAPVIRLWSQQIQAWRTHYELERVQMTIIAVIELGIADCCSCWETCRLPFLRSQATWVPPPPAPRPPDPTPLLSAAWRPRLLAILLLPCTKVGPQCFPHHSNDEPSLNHNQKWVYKEATARDIMQYRQPTIALIMAALSSCLLLQAGHGAAPAHLCIWAA